MIYGMYLSAAGIAEARTTQDTIANNLANSETNGFKRLMTLHQHRNPEKSPGMHNDMTGGNILLPTHIDTTQGGLDQTGNALDLALIGEGHLAVTRRDDPAGKILLTRDGRLALDQDGNLTLATDPTTRITDTLGQPIQLDPAVSGGDLSIGEDGSLVNARTGDVLAMLRLAIAADSSAVQQMGGGLLDPGGAVIDAPANSTVVQSGFIERSNVDPTVELTRMMEAGRLLEANANMIRQQDETLGKLIEASRIG